MNKLRGLIAAPFTPLTEKGDLDIKQIRHLVKLYEKNGVSGAFLSGSTGEGASLTHEEKKTIIEVWGKEKGDNLKVLFNLGGTCLREMQELARLAQEHHLDGTAILCPYYFKPSSVNSLVKFCSEVASASPQLPFYYYHIPAFTHSNYSMLEFLKQADGVIPNLAGIKFTAPDLFDFQACTMYKDGKYNLLWGIDEALLSGLAAGADGAVGSTYNYAAPLYNQIIKAFENNDMAGARKLQLRSVEMVQCLVKYGGIGAGKAFMKLIGIDCGWFRLPIERPSDDEVQLLKRDLEEIGFYDYCSKP